MIGRLTRQLGYAAILALMPLSSVGGQDDVLAPTNDTGLKDTSKCEVVCSDSRADDLWLISTRHLNCECLDKTTSLVDLKIRHLVGQDQWIDATLEEFLHGGPVDQPMLFYVHGNRVDSCEAIGRGLNLYHGLLDCSGAARTRFVIWSWPSDQVHGQVQDVRAKAARTNIEGSYFAWLLSQIEPATPVSIASYSFGARVTSGALHVLSGGKLAGCTLPSHSLRPPGTMRVSMSAAALHNHWLQPGGCHELALDQMERLLVQYNPRDPVLKRYRFIEKRARPVALGYTGMYADETLATWIEQRNVSYAIGRSHVEARYTSSPGVMQQLRETLIPW